MNAPLKDQVLSQPSEETTPFMIQDETNLGEFLGRVIKDLDIKTTDHVLVDYRGRYGLIKVKRRSEKDRLYIRFKLIEAKKDEFYVYLVDTEVMNRDLLRITILELKDLGYCVKDIVEYTNAHVYTVRNIINNHRSKK